VERAAIGWNIVKMFATSEMSLPEAKRALAAALKDNYNKEDWQSALRMVTKTEPHKVGQLPARLAELQHTLTGSSNITQLSPVTSFKSPAELIQQEQRSQEDQLMEKVHKLKDQCLIFNMPTIAELLDNPEEQLVGKSDYTFADNEAIIKQVRQEAEHPQEHNCDNSVTNQHPQLAVTHKSRTGSWLGRARSRRRCR
jgi:carboxylesterase type B